MKILASVLMVFVMLFTVSASALAHFGMLLAEPPYVELMDKNQAALQLRFWHPRENQGMNMVKPEAFGVWHNGAKQDLLPTLKVANEQGWEYWQSGYTFSAPSDYIFYYTPVPYWEPAENRFIVHHTKLVVDAFAMQDGWDTVLGLPVEIVPLTRPYGLYAGNSFTGQVLQNSQPLPDCEVEIEFYDPKGEKPASREALVTQVVKTDNNGCFTWTFPWSGWWGMAALADGGQITVDNRSADLEVGGVLWIYID